jgi:hypothetical protein
LALTQGHVDNQNLLVGLSASTSIWRSARSSTKVGIWVGISRFLKTPLSGVYFSLDVFPGLDQGTLQGPFDPTTGLTVLPDDSYRMAKIIVMPGSSWIRTVPPVIGCSAEKMA